MDEVQFYARIIQFLAEQAIEAQFNAAEVLSEIYAKGIDPADLDSDYSLVELGLAEEIDGVTNADGTPTVRYLEVNDEEHVELRLQMPPEDEDE